LLFCDSEARQPRFVGSSPAGDQPAALLVAGSAEVGVLAGAGSLAAFRAAVSSASRWTPETGSPPGTASPQRRILRWPGQARLSRADNRQINRTLHIMATVQLRSATDGPANFDRTNAAGQTPTKPSAR
jgi:hypothetical protein